MIVWRGDTARVSAFELIVTHAGTAHQPNYQWAVILYPPTAFPTMVLRSGTDITTERFARQAAEAAVEGIARDVLANFPPRTVHDEIAQHPFVCQGEHDCQGSISGRCWYNSKLDPSHNACMWCGQPEERM